MSTINTKYNYTTDIYSSLITPRNVLGTGEDNIYSLQRGVMDFGNLAQWEMFEKGYAFMKIIKMPTVLEKLAAANANYEALINTYKKILEFEFKSVSGLIPNIETDEMNITNNIDQIDLVAKTTQARNVSFTLTYYERSGHPLTKVHELWLKAIKDPMTTYKHYFGMIADGTIGYDAVGYASEVASFLFGFTDNTGLRLERAVLVQGVQPSNAPLNDLFDYTKGTVEPAEASLEFKGHAISNNYVQAAAKTVLKYLNTNTSSDYIPKDEEEVETSGISDIEDAVPTSE